MTIQAINGQAAALVSPKADASAQQAKGATQPTSATQSSGNTSSAQSTKPSASYSVSISGAARAALVEATETSVQTAQEAHRGDLQAQHLLAKEQAQKAAQG